MGVRGDPQQPAQVFASCRRILRRSQGGTERVDPRRIRLGPLQPFRLAFWDGIAGCPRTRGEAEGADLFGTGPRLRLLDENLRAMLLDLQLPRPSNGRVPFALLLGLAEFRFLLPAFGLRRPVFKTLQKESEARLQRPPSAVTVRIGMLIPRSGRRPDFETPVELVIVFGKTRPGTALLLAQLLSGGLVGHLRCPLRDGERVGVPVDDEDQLVQRSASLQVGSRLDPVPAVSASVRSACMIRRARSASGRDTCRGMSSGLSRVSIGAWDLPRALRVARTRA
ncbi:hypothetical protein AMK17_24550 [Streptomyces sp. CB00072]|nr:hypothetical protein AMK17_24550 [Streptomyces sp. CB00072]